MKNEILIIDDMKLMRRNVQAVLDRYGYTTFVAEDGQQGLEIAKEKIPDLVITDIMMPKMNGYTFLKFFKLDKKLKNVPVIVLTALDKKEEVLKALKLGAISYITKPFSIKDLLTKIETVLKTANTKSGEEN